jgi:hypothetical protein
LLDALVFLEIRFALVPLNSLDVNLILTGPESAVPSDKLSLASAWEGISPSYRRLVLACKSGMRVEQ